MLQPQSEVDRVVHGSSISNPRSRAMTLVAMTMTVLLLGIFASALSSHPGSLYARDFNAAGEILELSIDDGGAECTLGQSKSLKGTPGFGWVNKLTPPTYPATLRVITIGFERNLLNTSVRPDSLYRIVAYRDPEGDGPNNGQSPDSTFIGRVRGSEQTMSFNLITPLTITTGSFVVGAIDEYGIADIPALFDKPGKSNPPGSDSFVTFNGGTRWQPLSELVPPDPFCPPGSLLIRATVELGQVNPLTIQRLQDPAAVEPWGVGSLGSDVIVTNLVSDNLTIVNARTGSLRNFVLVDPRACAACGPPLGPFGVVGLSAREKVYVTLFGSNTIPSKEFPVDYSTVMPGRVAVLTRLANGNYAENLFISVGKGPRFPALAVGKLYVPCGGDNRVDVINTANDQKIAEIPVGNDPSSCTASLDEGKVYVTNFGDGTVSVIDTKTDKKIKDIPAPFILFPQSIGPRPEAPTVPAVAKNPWNATVSPANGNLYVTYWSTSSGDVTPSGAIVEFDTCSDEVVRAIIDDTTPGTPSGSAGASGIPAPTAPLTRDAATGKSLEAGGGGGGPFGISACFPNGLVAHPSSVLFTNDGLGIAGVLDARIDQVMSAPAVSSPSCPKPRGIACVSVLLQPLTGDPTPREFHVAFVACGQPDNSVLMIPLPELTENIPTIPVIESAEIGNVLRLGGSGFAQFDTRIEVLRGTTCLTFPRSPSIKKHRKVLVQKGRLSDDSKLGDLINQGAIIRLVHPDGTTRVIGR